MIDEKTIDGNSQGHQFVGPDDSKEESVFGREVDVTPFDIESFKSPSDIDHEYGEGTYKRIRDACGGTGLRELMNYAMKFGMSSFATHLHTDTAMVAYIAECEKEEREDLGKIKPEHLTDLADFEEDITNEMKEAEPFSESRWVGYLRSFLDPNGEELSPLGRQMKRTVYKLIPRAILERLENEVKKRIKEEEKISRIIDRLDTDEDGLIDLGDLIKKVFGKDIKDVNLEDDDIFVALRTKGGSNEYSPSSINKEDALLFCSRFKRLESYSDK